MNTRIRCFAADINTNTNVRFRQAAALKARNYAPTATTAKKRARCVPSVTNDVTATELPQSDNIATMPVFPPINAVRPVEDKGKGKGKEPKEDTSMDLFVDIPETPETNLNDVDGGCTSAAALEEDAQLRDEVVDFGLFDLADLFPDLLDGNLPW